jgi:hypothetical protein
MIMPVRFPLFLVVLFASCGVQSTADLLLDKPCGENYTINYNSTYGLFIIQRAGNSDTLSLGENWNLALYRMKQCTGDIAPGMSYDEFRKSPHFFIPGGKNQFELLNHNPRAVFESTEAPILCDCMDEAGNYDASNPSCEKKFQIYRSGFNDSLSWLFAYYRDKCRGEVNGQPFESWKDTVLATADRAEQQARRQRYIQDSAESTGPPRQCSGSDYLAPHQRSNSFSIYRQCRATTRHSSGRCVKHR